MSIHEGAHSSFMLRNNWNENMEFIYLYIIE